jgi:hypothetical protein
VIEERALVSRLDLRTNRDAHPHLRGELRLIWSGAVAYTKEAWLRRAQNEYIFALDESRQDGDQAGAPLYPKPQPSAQRS